MIRQIQNWFNLNDSDMNQIPTFPQDTIRTGTKANVWWEVLSDTLRVREDIHSWLDMFWLCPILQWQFLFVLVQA